MCTDIGLHFCGARLSTERVPRRSLACIRQRQLLPNQTDHKCKIGQKIGYRAFALSGTQLAYRCAVSSKTLVFVADSACECKRPGYVRFLRESQFASIHF